MKTVIINYGSGNIRSVAKSFARVSNSTTRSRILVTSSPKQILNADSLVMPGVGAFPHCHESLMKIEGLSQAIKQRVLNDGVPFLGICVGFQMLATESQEHNKTTAGFNWIKGNVKKLPSNNGKYKVPHMGWNSLILDKPHPLFHNIANGEHMYFVHSYHLELEDAKQEIAYVRYSEKITAAVSQENISGTQFHPEKSQASGLKFIANFLNWNPS